MTSDHPLVGIIMGSKSDWETMAHASRILSELGVEHEKKVVSAHRTPDWLFDYASSAEERGIEVSEITRTAAGNYQNMVRLRVGLETGELSVAGTLFSDQHPRVVEINGIDVEAALGANMLYVTNEDKPGFIGGLGTTLGNAGVNIATFNLGRSDRGGEALALVELDEPLPDEVLEAVRALPHVREAKALVR